MASEEHNSTGYIHGNAKPHLFNTETGFSYCGRYWQAPFYAQEIEFTGVDKHFCKQCLKNIEVFRE